MSENYDDSNSILVLPSMNTMEEKDGSETGSSSVVCMTESNKNTINSCAAYIVESESAFSSPSNNFWERRCEKLLSELSAIKQENNILRNRCGILIEKLTNDEKSNQKTSEKRTRVESENSEEKEKFVDVNDLIILEKFEYHLNEANKLVNDPSNLRESIEYLIKNIWSIVALQYNENNLDSFKMLREDLLTKYSRIDDILLENKQLNDENKQLKEEIKSLKEEKNTISKSSMIASSESLTFDKLKSINDEIGEFIQTDSKTIREKLIRQNEMLKSFVKMMSSQMETSEEEKKDHNGDDDDDDDNLNDEEEIPSPGSSPQSSIINTFRRLLNSNVKKQASKHQQHQQQAHGSVLNNNNNKARTSSQANVEENQSDDFFLYNHQGFIAIDRNLDLTRPEQQQQHQQEQTGEQNHRDEIEESQTDQTLQAESNTDMHQCPKCSMSVYSNVLSQQELRTHIDNCDLNKFLVCMVCLCLIDRNEPALFEQHVNSHFNNQLF